MIDYEKLPVVRMPFDEFLALEDRSAFIGDDRVPGKRFREDLRFFTFGASPQWVVGTFYLDEKKAREVRELDEYFERVAEETGLPRPAPTLFAGVEISLARVVCTRKVRRWFGLREEEVEFVPRDVSSDAEAQLRRWRALEEKYPKGQS